MNGSHFTFTLNSTRPIQLNSFVSVAIFIIITMLFMFILYNHCTSVCSAIIFKAVFPMEIACTVCPVLLIHTSHSEICIQHNQNEDEMNFMNWRWVYASSRNRQTVQGKRAWTSEMITEFSRFCTSMPNRCQFNQLINISKFRFWYFNRIPEFFIFDAFSKFKSWHKILRIHTVAAGRSPKREEK